MTDLICGIDEAGRGPGAGPVVAAAVILPAGFDCAGLDDSKKLTEKTREALYTRIIQQTAWGIGMAEPQEIDAINILHATMRAMERAVLHLPNPPAMALIDGNRVPAKLSCNGRAIIGGDGLEPAISAASILAKVTRDRLMMAADLRYPVYGFAQHKGYLTKVHKQALLVHGPCPIHRFSYAPIREAARRCSAATV
ncbi:Ribonuclease HII [hydrothermal vent metagenome]|uniref:Ribonuclease HII n=1 Tax=hydrothermal vent metagenome TaxID=652676 RepID=A0A3B0RIC0_9ZZZZ